MITVYATSNPFDCTARVCYQAESGTVSEILETLPEDIAKCGDRIAVFIGDMRQECERSDWDSTRIEDGDAISVIVIPGTGLEIAWTQIIVGMLVSAAVSFIGMLLFKPKLNQRDRDDESSATYNWTRIATNRRPGQPVEVLYGEMRVGGTMLGEFIRSFPSPVRSTLYQLISFGWGEFESIAGETEDTPPGTQLAGNLLPEKIFINENPIENVDGVLVQVRLGSNVQEPVVGFHEIATSVGTAGYTMDSPSVTTQSIDIATGYNISDPYTATNDAYWTAWARTEDILTPCDAVNVVISAPQGAYNQDSSSGALLDTQFQYQIRYRELDALNNPITTGGHASDGWVRLTPNFGQTPTVFHQTGPFDFDLRFPLYDPQTWTATTVLGNLGTGGALGKMVAAPTGLVPPDTGGSGNDMGIAVSLWFKRGSGLVADERVMLLTNQPTPFLSSTGLSVCLVYEPNYYIRNLPFGGPPIPRTGTGWHVEVSCASSGFSEFFKFSANISVGEWHHICVQNRGEDGGTRAYIDGVSAVSAGFSAGPASLISYTFRYKSPGSGANLELGYQSGVTRISPVQISFDDVRIFGVDGLDSYPLTGAQIQTLASAAESVNFPTLASQASFYQFESATGENSTSPLNAWYGPLSLSGGTGGSLSAAGGIIGISNTTAVRKRMKARVEVVKITSTTTNTRVVNNYEWNSYQRITDAALTYPRRAMLAIEADATEQLHGSQIDISSINKGVKVPVWDGVSTEFPAIVWKYSSNPAWVALDIATNDIYGGGSRYSLNDALSQELYELAQYCDEIVYDGYSTIAMGASAHNDIYYDDGTLLEDSNGNPCYRLEIRVSTSENPSIPVEWVPGHMLRIFGFADDAVSGIWVNLNNPSDLDPQGIGGYEIINSYKDSSTNFIYINVYFPISMLGSASEPWAGASAGAGFMSVIGAYLDGATLEGGEKRYEFNGVFDQSRGMWDALQEVLSVARAAPRRIGKKLRVSYERPRAWCAVITPASVRPGTLEVNYANVNDRENAFDYQIRDRNNLYKNRIVTVLDPDVNNYSNLSEIRKGRKELFGVTSVGQASRAGKFDLNVNKLIDCSGEFTTATSGLDIEVGDVLVLSGTNIDVGEGGRALAAGHGEIPFALDDTDDLTAAEWTAYASTVSALSTPNDPFGDPSNLVSDASAQLGVVYQASAYTDLQVGTYCFSCLAKAGTSSLVRLDIIGDKRRWASFDLSSGEVESQGGGESGGARIQAIGAAGWYLISVWGVVRGSSPILSISPACGVGGQDASATGNAYFSKPNFTSGQYTAHPYAADRAFILDHPLTTDGTEIVYFTDMESRTDEGYIDTGLCPAGAYDGGEVLFLSADLTNAVLERHTQYIIVADGGDLQIQVVGTKMGNDLSKVVEWVKYDANVYLDRADNSTRALTSDLLGQDHGMESRIPQHARINGISDLSVRSRAGVYQPMLRVSWRASGERLLENAIWVREAQKAGAWERLGSVDGASVFAELPLNGWNPGDDLHVAVQPVSPYGVKRRPDHCDYIGYTVSGLAARPAAPANVTARVQGRLARYSWDTDDTDSQVVVECRRGGWVLGDRVFTSAPGEVNSGNTEDWVGSDYSDVTLYFRAKNAAGFYSDAVTITQAMDPEGSDRYAPDVATPTKDWENFAAAGWERSVPSVGDPEIGAEFYQDGSGNLAWDVASTETAESVVYTTETVSIYPASGTPYEPREVYVDAYWEAVQVPPLARGDAGYDWDDMTLDRYETEGIISLLPGESNGFMKCQININFDGTATGWSGWQDYQPGLYKVVDVRFRLVASRPSTDYDISVTKFHTRIIAPIMSMEQRTPHRSLIESELF